MATLADVNDMLASGIDSFHLLSFDGSRLLVVGSFDLCYYHEVELKFIEVESIRCPVWFNVERIYDAGPGGEAGDCRRFHFVEDGRRHEIVARGVEVEWVRVYYYDRGEQLAPGERIAEWVKRADA